MKLYLPKLVFSLLTGAFGTAALFAQTTPAVPNWTVPPYPHTRAPGTLGTMADITSGAAFVGVTPCRLVDTRTTTMPNFPAGYGPPALTAGVPRTFDLHSAPKCPGFAPVVAAYSLNITVTNTQGPGFILIYPNGSAQPTVSTLNYVAGQTVANAAIVPGDSIGRVTVVAGVSGTELIIDINGYFPTSYNDNEQVAISGSSSGSMLFVTNSSTVPSGVASAITGQVVDNGAAARGVIGFANGAENGSAGTYGRVGGGQVFNGFIAAGVRGEAAAAGIGVFGLTGTGGSGAAGYRVSAGGALQAGSELGFTSTVGLQTFGTTAATGAKNFVEPHPTDPTKMIRYTSLEGNEAGTYFRGRGKFQNGMARIPVSEDFRTVTDPEGLTVQITPIGAMATCAVLRADLNEIVVQSSRNVDFYYLVQGIRRAYRHLGPIAENEKVFVPRSADERIPEYLPEVIRQRLIANGTYRSDGTVNLETARRLGWDKKWEEQSRPAPQSTEP